MLSGFGQWLLLIKKIVFEDVPFLTCNLGKKKRHTWDWNGVCSPYLTYPGRINNGVEMGHHKNFSII